MIDLDDFKEVNDRFGHPFGDQLLIHVGHILTETLRETDIPTRYGGDEFAIILPETSKTEAWVVAEKIRTALGELTLVTEDGRRISASGSIGVAALRARPPPRRMPCSRRLTRRCTAPSAAGATESSSLQVRGSVMHDALLGTTEGDRVRCGLCPARVSHRRGSARSVRGTWRRGRQSSGRSPTGS